GGQGGVTLTSGTSRSHRSSPYQAPPPPPPPPPPEKPPPPPLPPLPPGVSATAVLRLLEKPSRLLANTTAVNAPCPWYQLDTAALVSMPSNAFAQRCTQPKTIA